MMEAYALCMKMRRKKKKQRVGYVAKIYVLN